MIYLIYMLCVYAVSYLIVYDDKFEIVKDSIISSLTLLKFGRIDLVEHLLDCQPCLSFWLSIPFGMYLFGWAFLVFSLATFAFTAIVSDLTN